MLGEELHATTISRDYFTNIFDSVSDMIFVLTQKGVISHCNRVACDRLGCPQEQIIGKKPEVFQPEGRRIRTSFLLRKLKEGGKVRISDFVFAAPAGGVIPVDVTLGHLPDNNRKAAVLLTARDITHVIRMENLILSMVIATEEKERRRLAKDIHDSIGQQMSAAKFFISAAAENETERVEKELLRKANGIITALQSDIRRVCFNLMPKTKISG